MNSSKDIMENIYYGRIIKGLFQNGKVERRIKAKHDLHNQDYKTARAHHQGVIPEGTILKKGEVIRNFYGEYITTTYNGFLYYIDPNDVEEVGDFFTGTDKKFEPVKWVKQDGVCYKEYNKKLLDELAKN